MFLGEKSIRRRRLHSSTQRWTAALALVLPGAVAGAYGQAIPPTAPTQPASASAPSTPASQPPQAVRQAQVAYTAGRLQVNADDSSLNQILREIGRVTGMKITGGVAEERVFGSYGPADPSTVLSALLNGTGSNMMLRLDSSRRPEELVLTPRQGGPTPPNPSASRYASREDDLPPDRKYGRPRPIDRAGPPASAQNPAPTVPQPAPQPSTGPPVSPSPGADTTTQQSPNGVKTPQEIYDQLMKMQQQQKPPQ